MKRMKMKHLRLTLFLVTILNYPLAFAGEPASRTGSVGAAQAIQNQSAIRYGKIAEEELKAAQDADKKMKNATNKADVEKYKKERDEHLKKYEQASGQAMSDIAYERSNSGIKDLLRTNETPNIDLSTTPGGLPGPHNPLPSGNSPPTTVPPQFGRLESVDLFPPNFPDLIDLGK